MTVSKAVLAYSGGLDTSAIIPWLIEQYGCEVIAVVGDIGQGEAELEGIEAKAEQSGASACYVVDLKHEFVERYAFPTLVAGAVYEGRYLLGTAIARPALARAQAQVALDVGADALVHGCTGKGNDQVRFETVYARFAPHVKVIAPWREWAMRSREELLEYIHARGIPCSASVQKIYSRDANLWHASHEGGALEDPWVAPPEDVWMRTVAPEAAPDTPQEIVLGFEHGRPRTIDGTELPPVELVTRLNEIAGKHGVGRVDLVESRLVGMKSRGCYESPGPHVLSEALRSLEEIVLDRPTLHYRQQLALEFAELVYDGQWFTPLREALTACCDQIAERLTGEVAVRLYKGTALPHRRRSENSLYSAELATFGADDVYDHAHAEGFIRLFSLPSRAAASKIELSETVLKEAVV
ncbi:MAG: argininosuccinate synthase [Planctomycetes bacterium]|nr:argininosuccinate synthase [Planctomycetota bacterium]